MIEKQKACNISSSLKDVDKKNKTATIIVSAYEPDKHGDLILKGAYSDIINNYKNNSEYKTVHCLDHDMQKCVGVPKSMQETDEGLEIVTKFSNSTLAKDTYENYLVDMYQHSVFILWKGDDAEYSEKDDLNVIKKVSYMPEYSSVIFGANPKTPTKQISKSKYLSQLKEEDIEILLMLAKDYKAEKQKKYKEFVQKLNNIK